MSTPQFHPFNCDKCNARLPHPGPQGGASGYATLRNGRRICYECADAGEREALKDRSKPMTGYLSGDSKRWTTWTGGLLGNVVGLTKARNPFGGTLYIVRVRDAHGRNWYGRGAGPSMILNLRPTKA